MKNINIKTSEDIEKITPESLKLDAVEIERIHSLEWAKKLIEDELNAYKKATLDKYEHKATNDGKVKITISEYMTFSQDEFIARYGAEKLEELKVNPVRRETVKFK